VTFESPKQNKKRTIKRGLYFKKIPEKRLRKEKVGKEGLPTRVKLRGAPKEEGRAIGVAFVKSQKTAWGKKKVGVGGQKIQKRGKREAGLSRPKINKG